MGLFKKEIIFDRDFSPTLKDLIGSRSLSPFFVE